MTSPDRPDISMKLSTLGGVIGNVMEWYDFGVFGYFAPIIASQFFPSGNKLAGLINTFGVFAAGYMMRPIGGVIFGHIGDRLGRKKALQLSVILMAVPTTLLGFLPTHAQIGLTAAALLTLLRLLQGLSVGGELIGSISFITETAPAHRRGYYGSWTLFGAVSGIMLGSGVAALLHRIMSTEALNAWGWRIPFICGCLIGLFGLWMRRGMEETEAFKEIKESGRIDKNPVWTALKSAPRAIFHTASLVVLMGGGFYTMFVWWPTYLTKMIKPPVAHALGINTLAMALFMCLIPVCGWLSDRLGRRLVLSVGCGGILLLAYPMICLADHGSMLAALTAQLSLGVFLAMIQGPMPATMVELFPTQHRFSGVAVGYNITLALFGGTAPLVATWLISATNDLAAPAYYIAVMAAISLAACVKLKNRATDEPTAAPAADNDRAGEPVEPT